MTNRRDATIQEVFSILKNGGKAWHVDCSVELIDNELIVVDFDQKLKLTSPNLENWQIEQEENPDVIDVIDVKSHFNGRHGVLVESSTNNLLKESILGHCLDSIKSGKYGLNDSKQNRDILIGILKAHGFSANFINPRLER